MKLFQVRSSMAITSMTCIAFPRSLLRRKKDWDFGCGDGRRCGSRENWCSIRSAESTRHAFDNWNGIGIREPHAGSPRGAQFTEGRASSSSAGDIALIFAAAHGWKGTVELSAGGAYWRISGNHIGEIGWPSAVERLLLCGRRTRIFLRSPHDGDARHGRDLSVPECNRRALFAWFQFWPSS